MSASAVFWEILFVIDSPQITKKKQFTSKPRRTAAENRISGVIRIIFVLFHETYSLLHKRKNTELIHIIIYFDILF